MKVAVVILAALALASAMPNKPSGYRPARARDLSKFKSPMPKVTVNSPLKIKLRKVLDSLIPEAEKPIKKTPAPRQSDCGIMGGKINPKIVEGQEATPHQFPWQVGIFLDGSYFCGGSILDATHILTAAHCVDGFSFWDVIIGAHSVNPADADAIEISTTDGVVHPGWDAFVLANDIAILILPEPLTFNDNVMPICLPSLDDVGETLEGEDCITSGWGRESDASQSIARYLNYMTATIISNRECNDIYGIVGDGVVCIETVNGGTCNGDSGGPLIIDRNGDGFHTQYGVVSFGASAGCELDYPAGFTRVTEYLDFIADNTKLIL